MMVHYTPQGVCSTQFHAEISDEGVIESLSVENGCNGNGKGIGQLVKGRRVDEIAALLEGIRCGRKQSSCPDQIAKMMKEIKKQREAQ